MNEDEIRAMKLAEKALKLRDYRIDDTQILSHANIVYVTDKQPFFLKIDSRPWFKPLGVSFRGSSIAIWRSMYEQYIRPKDMDYLYYYKDQQKLYHADNSDFTKYGQFTRQVNHEPVFAYPFSRAELWASERPENQTGLF